MLFDRILEEDEGRPVKQRHTAKRILERLRDEYGFTGRPPRKGSRNGPGFLRPRAACGLPLHPRADTPRRLEG